MRFLALDIGDVWTGVAIADPSGIIASPYTTLHCDSFFDELNLIIKKEKITHIVIGYPQTMKGTESAQTKKVVITSKDIEEQCAVACILIDERCTSKAATRLKQAKNKDDKKKQHAIAAALILTSFLDHAQFNKDI